MFSSQSLNSFSCFSGSLSFYLHGGQRSDGISPPVALLRDKRAAEDNGFGEISLL